MSSTSLSNPQSLNLYSYVGNDPVNRTDPSGLFWGKLFGFLKTLVKVVMVALAVALIVVAIVNIGNPLVSAAMIWGAFALAGLLLGAALGPSWMKRAISIAGVATGIYMQKPGAIWNFADPGNRGATGIGAWLSAVSAINLFLQQQNPGRDEKEITDCQQFAATVDVIAMNSTSRRGFLDELARTFTPANNSSIGEMRRTQNLGLPAGRPTFRDSGFQTQFLDRSNQVRHFVGGFIAGADIGWIPGRTVMNSREQAGVDDADIALNGVSTFLGASTIGHGIGYIRKNIANEIRKQVCR